MISELFHRRYFAGLMKVSIHTYEFHSADTSNGKSILSWNFRQFLLLFNCFIFIGLYLFGSVVTHRRQKIAKQFEGAYREKENGGKTKSSEHGI